MKNCKGFRFKPEKRIDISILIAKGLQVLCCLCVLLQSGYVQTVEGKSDDFKQANNYIQIAGYGSSNSRTPFWVQSNQFGTAPGTSPAGSSSAALEHFFSLSHDNTKWRVGLGAEAVANFTTNAKVLIPQLHGSIRYKNWEFFVGRKKQWVGLADSTHGTGSYAWSTNTMPLPKIHIGTTKFVDVPFTNGWLSFNAFYSDGLFEKGRPFTSSLKLHQKALYLRIGNKNSRLKLLGGLNHECQWGGRSPFQTKDGQMPKSFRDYIDVVTAKAYPVGDNLTAFDYNNRIGNHLGSIDVGLQYFGYEYSWFFYRQSIYEDGSLFRLENIADGLNGVSIRKQNSYGADFEVTDFVLEFLYTKNQGGSTWDLQSILGRDNYFNNSQVADGWSYFGRTIGTPFIVPTTDTKWKYPSYSFTSNNRVAVLHAGLKGTLFQKVRWEGKFSWSSNMGTYDMPFKGIPNQFSGIFSLSTRLKMLGGTDLRGAYAADIGNLYPDTHGFVLSMRKNFAFR